MSFSDGFLMGSAIGMNATFGSLTRSALGAGGLTPFDTCYVDLDSRSGFSSWADPSLANRFVLNSSMSSAPILPGIFAYTNPFAGGYGGYGGYGCNSIFGSLLGFGSGFGLGSGLDYGSGLGFGGFGSYF